MIYLQQFDSTSAYEAVKDSLVAPNVSWDKETDIVHYLGISSGPNTNGHEYVDLGLPSGTLWATMNIGANSETDYGQYFQWGDTVDKSNAECSWNTYKFSNDDSGKTITKYNDEDGKTVLDLEDDASYMCWGGDWRIPSKEQCDELRSNTTKSWITNYQGSGVNGRLFTSKIDSSKSIFIPASGMRGTKFYQVGSYAYIWTSTLSTDKLNASQRSWHFDCWADNCATQDNYYRFEGFAVRPVCSYVKSESDIESTSTTTKTESTSTTTKKIIIPEPTEPGPPAPEPGQWQE